MKPEDALDSNYRNVVLAARRARQIQGGSQPLIATRSSKACRIAQDEVAAGKIKFIQPKTLEPAPHAELSPDPPEETKL